MNKGWKTFLIVCASLCLAGVILGAAGLIKGVAKLVSWDGKGLDGLSVQTQAQPVEQSMALAPFTGLKVEAACDVNLIPCDHDGVEYTVYDRTHLPVIEQDGETVTVSYPGRNGFQLNFSFGQRDRIDIYYEQSRTLE
ncbi:MAG: hypothetical protein PHD32_10725 [Eubacteriales bacterium]|nr:hypothetical protein [Eubacteriales bacterium]